MPLTSPINTTQAFKNAVYYPSWKLSTGALHIVAVSAMFPLCFLQCHFLVKFAISFALLLFLLFFLLYTADTVSATSPKIQYMPNASGNHPSRLIIYASDVKKIHNCSDSTASRKLQLVKETFGKKEHHEVTVKEYCDYWGLAFVETCQFLNLL